jgi:hypothetical protein
VCEKRDRKQDEGESTRAKKECAKAREKERMIERERASENRVYTQARGKERWRREREREKMSVGQPESRVPD